MTSAGDQGIESAPTWAAATPGLLVALTLVLSAVATAKLTLLACRVPVGIELLAGSLALLCLGLSTTAPARIVAGPAATLATVGAGFAGLALGRLLPEEPLAVAALWGPLLLLSAIVGLRTWIRSAAGILGGAALAFLILPAASAGSSGLSVEPTYRGMAIAPVWMAVDRSLLVGAAALVGGCLLLILQTRRSGSEEEMRRYQALGRLMRGKGGLTAAHYGAVVAALADHRWCVAGVALAEDGMLRVLAARAPGGQVPWSTFARALRDGVVPLQDAENSLARAARLATVVTVHSCRELIGGMLRRFSPEEHHTAGSPREGCVVPFGSTAMRGVLFAVGDAESFPRKDWLLDLAAVLTLIERQATEKGGGSQ